MPETYISIDVETTGLAAGLSSMIALGAVAIDKQGRYKGSWYDTLSRLPDAKDSPGTLAWWSEQSEGVRDQAFSARSTPADAMASFEAWVKHFPDPIAAAWPASFDFAWVNYYAWRFLGGNPLGYRCLDLRSYAAGLTRSRSYNHLREEDIWTASPRRRLAHNALADAWDQADLLAALLARAKGNPEKITLGEPLPE